jgi:hypothetical protein
MPWQCSPASLEVLEKAAVPPARARAIVQAIEIESGRLTQLTHGEGFEGSTA